MKKATYDKPQVEVIEFSTSHMLSSSIYMDDNEENIEGRTQKRRGDNWGNFWEDNSKRY